MIKVFRTILVLLLLLSSTAFAISSIYGPTGLITIPTAESVQFREFSIAADYLFTNTTSTTVVKNDAYYYKMNMGTYKNWELGIVAGKVPTEGAFVNIKYYLTSDGEKSPISLALGCQNLFSAERTDLYMVASKRFPAGFALHFGFKANFGKTEVYPSIIGGIEYFLSNRVSFVADAGGEKKAYKVSGGLRISLTDTLFLNLSAVDIGNASTTGTLYGMGLSYTTFL